MVAQGVTLILHLGISAGKASMVQTDTLCTYSRECICIHLENNQDKFNCLVYMTRKLFAHAKYECCAESADNPANQEVLLPGHLYLMVLKVF